MAVVIPCQNLREYPRINPKLETLVIKTSCPAEATVAENPQVVAGIVRTHSNDFLVYFTLTCKSENLPAAPAAGSLSDELVTSILFFKRLQIRFCFELFPFHASSLPPSIDKDERVLAEKIY